MRSDFFGLSLQRARGRRPAVTQACAAHPGPGGLGRSSLWHVSLQGLSLPQAAVKDGAQPWEVR
ncbi:MAG: hypothetical protein ACLQDQ_16745 [Myxococcaceae bacterium]